MAERRGQRPSEVLGIGCDYCAWCFDEAMYVLEVMEREAEATERLAASEHEATLADLRERMRRGEAG